ncbi:MAG: DUF1080 domain-containing protein [Planctomycetes bacterium]|nr:DUF1080 domain-containing protein [Planctomycetota bacterium]
MMKSIIALLILSLTSSLFAEDWISLFDGKSLKGWHLACKKSELHKAKSYWSVVEGSIICDTKGDKNHDYIWMMSDLEYADFELRFEVKSNSKGNSGIQIRSRYDEKTEWLNGPQVDIHPSGPWRCGFIYDETHETKRWIYPSLKDSRIKPDKAVDGWKWDSNGWNKVFIRCKGAQIYTLVNGVEISNYDGSGLLDDKDHKKHNVGMKGHLALQLHKRNDLKISFRKIEIKEL